MYVASNTASLLFKSPMPTLESPPLQTLLSATPFASYAYSYPHKTAYRPLAPRALREVWKHEPHAARFLYLHVPFCEMRCGFCNLFTHIERDAAAHERFLDALERQMRAVASEIGDGQFARMAIGGGTPTILSPHALERLFDLAARYFGANPAQIPSSVETSPATATPERLQILKNRSVSRVSIGVQSFIEVETRALGRPQKSEELCGALERIGAANFPIFNLDLIYGTAGQTRESWLHSLWEALHFAPDEIYLYPLYVRPLTGLGKRGAAADNSQLELYRAGRDYLLENGFRQISMRMFQRAGVADMNGPHYCCQQDGMVGLGAGARSYTRALHYSTEYAVGAQGVRAILGHYLDRDEPSFRFCDYGFELDAEEQRRRYLIQSLLQIDGLNWHAYERYFGTSARDDFPQLGELEALDLARDDGEVLRPTPEGLEWSDVLGPWLASARVREQMEGFSLR